MCRSLFVLLALSARLASGLRRHSKKAATAASEGDPEVAFLETYIKAQQEDQLGSDEAQAKLGYLFCDKFQQQYSQYNITCGKGVDKKKSSFERIDYLSQAVGEDKCVEECDKDASCIGFTYERNYAYMFGACELLKAGKGGACLATSRWVLPVLLNYVFMKEGKTRTC